MKTYIVTGESGQGLDRDMQILYAGDGEEKASKIEPDNHYHTLNLQIWIKGMLVIQKVKSVNNKWDLTFNMIDDLEKSIQDRRKVIEAKQRELEEELTLSNELRDILGQ